MQSVEKIDPKKEYSLTYLVKNGLFGKVRQFSTARQHAVEDLMTKTPVLKTEIRMEGFRRTYKVLGKNLLTYLSSK